MTKIIIELSSTELEFLEYVAKSEGITPAEYLAKRAKGKLIKGKTKKNRPRRQVEETTGGG